LSSALKASTPDWFRDQRLGFGTGAVDSHHFSPASQHVSSGSSWHISPLNVTVRLSSTRGRHRKIRGRYLRPKMQKTRRAAAKRGVVLNAIWGLPLMSGFYRLDPSDPQIWRAKASGWCCFFGNDLGHCSMVLESPASSSWDGVFSTRNRESFESGFPCRESASRAHSAACVRESGCPPIHAEVSIARWQRQNKDYEQI
jgi:hypothetical protein